jgi:hypothetical protein
MGEERWLPQLGSRVYALKLRKVGVVVKRGRNVRYLVAFGDGTGPLRYRWLRLEDLTPSPGKIDDPRRVPRD